MTYQHFSNRPHFLDCECKCEHKRVRLQQAIKKRLLGFSSVTRSFWTTQIGKQKTTSPQEVRYEEYQGIGHPNSTGRPYGQPGDIYIDLTPERHQLYAKTLTLEWAVWPGPMIILNGLRHPHNSDYILTCKLSNSGASIGWYYKGIRQNFELSAHEIIATVLKTRANLDRPKKRTRAKTPDGDDSRRKMSKKRKNNADAAETNDPPRKTPRTACEGLGPTPSTLESVVTNATLESVVHTHCSTLTSGTLENAIRHTSPAHVASEITASASDWNVRSTSRQGLRDSDTGTDMQDGHLEKVSQVASEHTDVATVEPNHAPSCLPVSQGPNEEILEQIPEQLSCGTTDAIVESETNYISPGQQPKESSQNGPDTDVVMESRHSSPDVPNINEINALDPSLEKSKEVVRISSPELLNTTSSGAPLDPSNGGNLDLSSDSVEPKEKPHNPSLESSQNIDLVTTPLADSIVTDERNMTLRSPEETTGTEKPKLPDQIQKSAVSNTSTGHDLVIKAPILPTDEDSQALDSQAPDSPDVPVILQVNNSTSNSSRLEIPRLDSNDESPAPLLTEAGGHIGNHLDEIVISDSKQTNVKIEDDPCMSLPCSSSNVPFVSLDNSSAVLNSNTAKGSFSDLDRHRMEIVFHPSGPEQVICRLCLALPPPRLVKFPHMTDLDTLFHHCQQEHSDFAEVLMGLDREQLSALEGMLTGDDP